MEYNEELRSMEKSDGAEERKSVRTAEKSKCTGKNCTAISRKADSSRNGQLRKNLWIENDKKGGNDYEENNFLKKWAALISGVGIILSPVLPC